MKSTFNKIDNALIIIASSIALTDIETILSIAILVVQAVWILVKLGINLYTHIKAKNATEVLKDISTTKDELTDLKEDASKKE